MSCMMLVYLGISLWEILSWMFVHINYTKLMRNDIYPFTHQKV
jgi:hypothetical protein